MSLSAIWYCPDKRRLHPPDALDRRKSAKRQLYISLMSQYTPYEKNPQFPELNRRITSYEYQKVVDTALDLGLTQGFMQEKSSAKEEYTPDFNLEGL